MQLTTLGYFFSSTILLLFICNRKVSSEDYFDIDLPKIFTPNDRIPIEFGYSVALFQNKTVKRLLVGAPSAQTAQNVIQPGAVYACDLKQSKFTSPNPNVCHQVEVDTRNATDKYRPFITRDVKDRQRLGASIATKNNNIVICAPNWHYFEKRGQSTIDTPVGICFNGSSLENFEPFSAPFDTKGGSTITYVNTGSCQSGFSSLITEDKKIALGSPGCYNWKGDLWVEYEEKKWMTWSHPNNPGAQINDYDKYIGYSVATGKFGGLTGVVAGMPRLTTPTNDGLGQKISIPKVGIYRLMNSDLSLWTTLTPPARPDGTYDPIWLFSYFGHSVAIGDVDGNGLDDIIVGAPFYHNSTHPDQGAILLFLQIRELTVDRGEIIRMVPEDNTILRVGNGAYARFGSSIASLGDIDGDGITDIAVGAPYSKDGGVVYLFLGSKGGLSRNPNQVIKASDDKLNDFQLKRFGFSISDSFKMSDKGQNDLVVGATESDQVIIFSSNPVLTVNWSISFLESMDLKSRCPIAHGVFPCTEVIICISYSILGEQYDEVKIKRSFEVELHLDPDLSRLQFDDNSKKKNFSFTISYNKEGNCKSDKVYALATQKNLQPYDIRGEISFHPTRNDKALLDTRTQTIKTEILQVKIECHTGIIATCISDIILTTEANPKTVYLESTSFKIQFNITNSGETSYYNKLELDMGDYVQLSGKIIILEGSSIRINIECGGNSEDGKTQCSLGTFINTGDILFFEIPFTTTESFLRIEHLRNNPKEFLVKSRVTSLSKIKNPGRAESKTRINIVALPKVDLTKDDSNTELVYYNNSEFFVSPEQAKTDEEIGPEVIHSFKVYNPKSYIIENVTIEIYWPLSILDSDLLYMKSWPEIKGVFVEMCTNEKKIGAIFTAMKGLPLVNDILWSIYSCSRNNIQPKEEFSINLKSRFVQNTVNTINKGTLLNEVKSFIFVSANPRILGEEMAVSSSNNMATDISYDISKPPSSETPAWAIVVGVLIGFVLLIIVACILRRFDFFKRKKKIQQIEAAHTEGEDITEEKKSELKSEEENEIAEREL